MKGLHILKEGIDKLEIHTYGEIMFPNKKKPEKGSIHASGAFRKYQTRTSA
jgi:hypothetical protein